MAIDPLNDSVDLVDHTRAMRLALAVMDDEPDRFNAVVAEANHDGTTHALVTALTRNLVLSSVARLTSRGARTDLVGQLAGIQELQEEEL
jgi:hypothetical protein